MSWFQWEIIPRFTCPRTDISVKSHPGPGMGKPAAQQLFTYTSRGTMEHRDFSACHVIVLRLSAEPLGWWEAHTVLSGTIHFSDVAEVLWLALNCLINSKEVSPHRSRLKNQWPWICSAWGRINNQCCSLHCNHSEP